MADAYTEAFARNYHWLHDDVGLSLGTTTPGVRAALLGLPPGARVLDAACGIGLDALALAKRGFEVVAADAGSAMVGRCRARLAAAGIEVPVVRSSWADLADHLAPRSFDAVLCTGNSLAHVPDRAAMVESFGAFANLLVDDGVLIADTHHWEVVFAAGEGMLAEPTIERDGVACRRSSGWWFPNGAGGPHVLNIDLELTGPNGVEQRSHTVEMYPFSVQELRDRLREAGFSIVTLDAVPDEDRYTVVAKRRA